MTSTKLNSIYSAIVGDLEQISSERYFVTITSFVASIFLLILCVVHIIMGLKIAPVIFAGISSLMMLGLYFFVRFGGWLFISKLILTVIGLFMLDLTWYAKFLSFGPVLFFILVFAALFIWVWEGKYLIIVLALYFLNIAVLGIIDSQAPDSLFRYPDPNTRTLDIYLSFFLYSTLLIFLLFLVKKEFTRQKEKAMKSDKLKSAFLANMSHEIRTPMNAIVGFSQLLSDGTNTENRQKFGNIIKNSGESLLRLIDDIIDLSKIEAGDLETEISDINIRELFIELKDYCYIELMKRGKSSIKLDFKLPIEAIYIQSDSLRLKQILSNLLNNAIKFTSKGSIKFSCEKINRELIFTVTDTGTGIRETDKDKIFDHFVKFNYQGLNTEGSGIGLSIVEKLIRLLNGKLWFESTYGKGSEFHFSIPFIASSNKAASDKKVPQSDLGPGRNKLKPILVVEDDIISYNLIREFLLPLNLEIYHVTDGKDAINFVKMNPDVQLILMDIKLPYMDGYEATKLIKQINPKIYIIAQTAYAMQGDMEKAIDVGFDNYITKPLDLNKLQKLVESHLSD